ncbi:MAG: hypothetical protein WKG00_37405, partial [Polyangiaceae bacterium]
MTAPPDRGGDDADLEGALQASSLSALRSMLLAGPRATRPGAVAAWLEASAGLPAEERLEALEAIARDGSGAARRTALRALGVEGARGRAPHVRALADAWSWGTAVAWRLTGRPIDIRFLTGAQLGHTRFDEPVIHVSAEPILSRAPHGRAIVEGLILHELGHRLFHAGPEGARVWREAHAERIGGLLNLVADEHLERRLRAVDASFGDRLKRLASWAFLHRPRELDVFALCATLGGRAGAVLAGTPLGVARGRSRVVVESGALLGALERGGHAFARFVRALRMGLGNRHGDPLVARALAEVAGGGGARSLKDREIGELLPLARALEGIFGWQARLADTVGAHESLVDGAEVDGELIGDDEIRAAARKRQRPGARAQRRERRGWSHRRLAGRALRAAAGGAHARLRPERARAPGGRGGQASPEAPGAAACRRDRHPGGARPAARALRSWARARPGDAARPANHGRTPRHTLRRRVPRAAGGLLVVNGRAAHRQR